MNKQISPDEQITEMGFEVQKLSCAGCVGRAERALASVPGVLSARVNLATHRAEVSARPETGLTELQTALRRAGYPMQVHTLEFDVGNMSCGSCIARVEQALATQPGVLRASANLSTGRVQADVLDAGAAPDLARALGAAGYPAKPVTDTDSPDPSARQAAEARALSRRVMLAFVLTLPVFVVEMGGHLVPPFHHWLLHSFGQTPLWLGQFLLTTAVLLGPGRGFYTSGLPALARGAPDMNSLVAIGTLAAWGYSTVALFAPGLLPDSAQAVYFEAAAVIVTLILLGRWLEARARGRTGAAIARLVGLQPRHARKLVDGAETEVALDDIVQGDTLRLRQGERLAADGELLSDHATLDESMITGEPLPAVKEQGARLVGGTVNSGDAFDMRVTATGGQTVLSQIIRMVERAQGAKLPVQALVDKVTLYFVPVVMAVAALTVVTWLAFGAGLNLALVAGVSVLIIACPCAMGLATPTSVMVGTGRAAELGVLFRKGSALQTLERVRVVAFDKTGTLTKGRPSLSRVVATPGLSEEAALALATALERDSDHPIAHSLRDAAAARGLTVPQAETIKSLTGLGLRGQVGNQSVLLGAARLMQAENVPVDALAEAASQAADLGETPFYLAVDGVAVALICVADKLRPGAADMIATLHRKGLTVAMISGDATATAQAVARDLGIDHVVAEVMPKDKLTALQDLRAAHGPVAFVGDGINDAPALAEADVGLAIGSGTDIAVEAADIVLASSQPRAVIAALDVSAQTMRNIRQNLFWAFAYNTALVPVAAGLLYPATGLMLSPMLAAGAMALSSVFVLSNALRLRYIRVQEVA
ncbi:heavy metal translocating P-type ATPase [Roseibaca sp. V10]|uniref:Heavy metal translocating P-type ATPase n=1 Tax=Roseinatronobacter domitianus TaxID=2940293 RepID=A0ABT0M2S1_9RHOB|nr:heavy metal translocating P-type ATPase [Roseibaca domitiana]